MNAPVSGRRFLRLLAVIVIVLVALAVLAIVILTALGAFTGNASGTSAGRPATTAALARGV